MNVQYYLVDHSLQMRRGKIMAQCCHGALYAHAEGIAKVDSYCTEYLRWYQNQMPKIVLKCTAEHLERAMAEYPRAVEVIDAGHTEVAPGTRTVVVLPVIPKHDAPDWVKELPLL